MPGICGSLKAWMVNNQMGRRNLTPEQMSYLRGERYTAEKGIAGGNGKNQYSKSNKEQCAHNEHIPKGSKADILAGEYKVARETIKRDEHFAKAVNIVSEIHDNPAEIKEVLLSGICGVLKIIQPGRISLWCILFSIAR